MTQINSDITSLNRFSPLQNYELSKSKTFLQTLNATIVQILQSSTVKRKIPNKTVVIDQFA